MRILLIKAEQLTETERWVAKPLGIMYLSAVARQHGHDVDLLDLRIERGREAKAKLDSQLREGPGLVGLSALSHQAKTVKRLANYVRKNSPRSFLVAGGPLASANTDYVLDETPADACVIGEGERTFPELLNAVERRANWRDLPGIAYRSNGASVTNPPADLVENLDDLPLPSWDQVDFDRYARFLSMSLRMGRIASIHTTRGCPYRCTYCQHYFGRRFRARSPEHVAGEIDLLYHRYGIRRLEIIDDCFNCDYDRATAILATIRDRYPKLRISFPNAVRGDLIDEPYVKLLKQARCEFMPIALESGSPRIQTMIRKNLNFEKIRKAAEYLDRYGIPSLACFMIGFPTETREEMEETFAMAREMKGLVPVFSLVTPFPKTDLWEMVHPDGARISPEQLDAGYGYHFQDDEGMALMERSLRMSRRGFLKPRYWFVIREEIRWRVTSQWEILLLKLLILVVPLDWKRRLIRTIDRRFDLCLE